MQAKEAIILAGGLGTRLRSTVSDLPKCMAPVAGQPFLKHVIRYFLSQGIERFIFSLGYKHKVIEHFLDHEFPYVNYQTCIEQEPLGTGGAIQLACKRATEKDVVVVNGDSLFKADIQATFSFHQQHRICPSFTDQPCSIRQICAESRQRHDHWPLLSRLLCC